jgi:nicotinamide mononucleotide transporter
VSVLEIIAVVVSVLGIWLATRRKLSSWPISIVACLLYVVVFQRARLYSDMLLQFVYVAFAIYGWWHWWRGVKDEGDVRVGRMPQSELWMGVVAGAAGSVALGWAMARYTNAAVPYMDSSLTAFSLVAQWWATRKYIANWWLWIVVDVIYIGLFAYKQLYLTAGLYASLVVLAALGVREWGRARQAQESAGPNLANAAASNVG